MQFRDVGPVIGGEIADFFHSFGLTDAHANKTDCSHRYDHGLRSPNWTRIGGTWRHTPNKVSRKASLWLIGASGLVADDVAVNNRSGPRSKEDIETRETAVFAKQAAVTFSLSVHRRAFLQMHETDLFTMAKVCIFVFLLFILTAAVIGLTVSHYILAHCCRIASTLQFRVQAML